MLVVKTLVLWCGNTVHWHPPHPYGALTVLFYIGTVRLIKVCAFKYLNSWVMSQPNLAVSSCEDVLSGRIYIFMQLAQFVASPSCQRMMEVILYREPKIFPGLSVETPSNRVKN